jgi:FAD/FMN-containing dehydrogenase
VDREDVRALYPRVEEFQQLRRALDPAEAFRNDLLDRWLPLS